MKNLYFSYASQLIFSYYFLISHLPAAHLFLLYAERIWEASVHQTGPAPPAPSSYPNWRHTKTGWGIPGGMPEPVA